MLIFILMLLTFRCFISFMLCFINDELKREIFYTLETRYQKTRKGNDWNFNYNYISFSCHFRIAITSITYLGNASADVSCEFVVINCRRLKQTAMMKEEIIFQATNSQLMIDGDFIFNENKPSQAANTSTVKLIKSNNYFLLSCH